MWSELGACDVGEDISYLDKWANPAIIRTNAIPDMGYKRGLV